MLSSADGSTLAASKRRPAARDEEARHRLSRCATVPSPFHELAHLECRYCDHTLAYPRPYGQSDIRASFVRLNLNCRTVSAVCSVPRGTLLEAFTGRLGVSGSPMATCTHTYNRDTYTFTNTHKYIYMHMCFWSLAEIVVQ